MGDGTVVAETTAARIAKVNPQFAKQDQYYAKLTEVAAYLSEPNSPMVDLQTQLQFTAKVSLSPTEAAEIAQIMSQSPTLPLRNDVLTAYAQKYNRP